MNKIQQITKDCPREDCSLSSRGGISTCLGWVPTYDKAGKRTDRGDPNTHTESYYCSSCRSGWFVSTQYGVSKITKDERYAAQSGK